MASICLGICGITTRINLINAVGFHLDIRKRYRNFLKPGHRLLDIDLSIRITDNIGDAETPPSVSMANKTIRIRGSRITCNIHRNRGRWKGSGSIEENIYQFDTLLRLLYSHIMLKDNGFLIHACGIRNNNDGYLFAGRSGSGKTTLARKTPYQDVLSDELVGLRLSDSNPVLMGTPFWGEFQKGGQPVSCALKGIYFLSKGIRPKLIPLPPVLALKKLLKLVLFFGKGVHSATATQKMLHSAAGYLLGKGAKQINLAKNTPYKTVLRMISHNGKQ
ncbi:MAG: hypothetical protein AB1599_09500 [Planctomycetota bacterium]